MPQENFGSRVDQALATPEASIPAELPWTYVSVFEEVREALAAPIGPTTPVAPEQPAQRAPAQSTTPHGEAPLLKRRVCALEGLLQALLVQLAKAEPELLARLEQAIAATSQSVEEDSDSCAAALIDAARREAAVGVEAPPGGASAVLPEGEAQGGDKRREDAASRQPRFRYRKVGGIWRLTMERQPRTVALRDEEAPAKAATPPAVTPAPAPSGSPGSARLLPPAGPRSSP